MRTFKVGAKDLLAGGGAFVRDTVAGLIRPADRADSWVVGSDRMDRDAADTSKDARVFFNKAKAAFRAGIATGAQWDDANVGVYSHAEGYGTQATSDATHAEGANTTASNWYAHAEGTDSIASGMVSHAEGQNTRAQGPYSHAEGLNSTASGHTSHAEGQSTTASGTASHAEGYVTTASGLASHAEGLYTLASRQAQRARGGGQFGQTGDAQANAFVARVQTTAALATRLGFDGQATATLTGMYTNMLTLLASRAHKVRIEAVARRTDVQGEMAGFSWEGLVGRDATGNARIIGTPVTKAWSDAAATGWTLTVGINTTDATNNYLEILATGEAGKTIRWVASIDTVEVAG